MAVTTELLWLVDIPAIQEGNVIRLSRGGTPATDAANRRRGSEFA